MRNELSNQVTIARSRFHTCRLVASSSYKQAARKDMINVYVNVLLITLGFIGLMILLSAIASALIPDAHNKVSDANRAQHRQDGDGHIYYRRPDGTMIHASDSCAACMANRAAELERQGYRIEHVPGQRNSGELE